MEKKTKQEKQTMSEFGALMFTGEIQHFANCALKIQLSFLILSYYESNEQFTKYSHTAVQRNFFIELYFTILCSSYKDQVQNHTKGFECFCGKYLLLVYT